MTGVGVFWFLQFAIILSTPENQHGPGSDGTIKDVFLYKPVVFSVYVSFQWSTGVLVLLVLVGAPQKLSWKCCSMKNHILIQDVSRRTVQVMFFGS